MTVRQYDYYIAGLSLEATLQVCKYTNFQRHMQEIKQLFYHVML